MSWKNILKSRFRHDEEGFAGESHLEDSKAWEDMENPKEMRDIMEKTQQGSGFHYDLKDTTYLAMDAFITDFKEAAGISKINRGRYGVSNTIAGMQGEIARGEDLEKRRALWEIMQKHYKDNARAYKDTWGEDWGTQ
jgi:hypothetical protein